jgi:hypothetical protein
MKCANCGTESSGKFCPSCGARLRTGKCAGCGETLPPGARFCTRCGTEAAAGSGRGRGGSAGGRRRRAAVTPPAGSNLPWYIAGVVLVILIIVLLVPMFGRDDGVPPRGAAPLGAMPDAGLDPLSGTPREQGDRLFNRVMAAREQGNTAEAQQFAPMGVQAYQAAEPLDDDGIYHLAMLQITAGDYAGAIASAQRILDREPNHLLALGAAGEAADLAGNDEAALGYYRRLIQAYPTEIGRGLMEYQDHVRIMPDLLETARRRVEELS